MRRLLEGKMEDNRLRWQQGPGNPVEDIQDLVDGRQPRWIGRLYTTNKPRRLTRPGVIGSMMREICGVLYEGELAQGVEDLARAFR